MPARRPPVAPFASDDEALQVLLGLVRDGKALTVLEAIPSLAPSTVAPRGTAVSAQGAAPVADPPPPVLATTPAFNAAFRRCPPDMSARLVPMLVSALQVVALPQLRAASDRQILEALVAQPTPPPRSEDSLEGLIAARSRKKRAPQPPPMAPPPSRKM